MKRNVPSVHRPREAVIVVHAKANGLASIDIKKPRRSSVLAAGFGAGFGAGAGAGDGAGAALGGGVSDMLTPNEEHQARRANRVAGGTLYVTLWSRQPFRFSKGDASPDCPRLLAARRAHSRLRETPGSPSSLLWEQE